PERPVRADLRIEVLAARSHLVHRALRKTLDGGDPERVPAPQRAQNASVGDDRGERRKPRAGLLECTLRLADRRGERTRRRLRIDVGVVEPAGIAQARKEGKEQGFGGRLAARRPPQRLGKRRRERVLRGSERLRLPGEG